MESFDLAAYLANGVENIVKNILRATLRDPRQSAFMLKYSLASREATQRRAAFEKEGEHIPPFLIASITSSCNLHCAGCYARHNQACGDDAPVKQLSQTDWLRLFHEARDLGVGFILLAGGEPLIRQDVIRGAGEVPEILFPIFTNGTLMNDSYIELFDRRRNLIPIFSIEGRENVTNERRGPGVYQQLLSGMERMHERRLLFGASVTVTRENLEEAASCGFVEELRGRGCKAIVYVEYVPVSPDSRDLA
ncbi:MAG: radical SAM protein, partial [Clostridia bacterium]|nr:radical SAM protein [Clostridia bacterium]